ncbi:MAG: hypothetical protein AAFR04_04625 [Pseudomonadota bacterium]
MKRSNGWLAASGHLIGGLTACVLIVLAIALPFTAHSASLKGDAFLRGYDRVPPGQWPKRTGRSPLEMLGHLYRDFPERLVGRPRLLVEMKRLGAKALVVDIERTGLLDDALDGERHRAVFARLDERWELRALGRQVRCARGDNRAWRQGRCP